MLKLAVAAVVLIVLLAGGTRAAIDDPLPGIDFMSLGYLSFSNEWGLSVQDFTYQRKFRILNPFDKDRYAIPDQIPSNGIQTAQAFYEFKQEIYNNTDEYVNNNGGQNGISFKAGDLFSFTADKQYKKIRERLSIQGRQWGTTGEQHTYFTIRGRPTELLRLGQDIKYMLSLTGHKFIAGNTTNQEKWRTIFLYYGDYIPTSVVLGGQVKMDTLIETNRLRVKTEDYIRRQLSFSFGMATTPNSPAPASVGSPVNPSNGVQPSQPVAVEGGGKRSAYMAKKRSAQEATTKRNDAPGINWGFSFTNVKEQFKSKLDDTFKQSTSTNITYFGGDPQQVNQDASEWRNWVPTIIQAPQVIEVRFVSMSKLLENDPELLAAWKSAYAYFKQWWIKNDMANKYESPFSPIEWDSGRMMRSVKPNMNAHIDSE